MDDRRPLQAVSVTSLDSAELRWYRTLRRPVEHHREGIFIAEGGKVVQRLLQSEVPVLSLLLTDEWLQLLRADLERRSPPPTVYVAPKRLLETIVGFPLHQGVMAAGAVPPSAGIDEVLDRSERPYALAAVDGLTNAENLGVLVRNCAAFGVQALLVGETSSSPYLRRAVRNSMGAIFRLPAVHVQDLADTLRMLRSERNITCIAAHPGGSGDLLNSAALKLDCCIVFGSEGEGISAGVLAACEQAVGIPMHNDVDSLNVASASAVFLHALADARRRTTP